MIYSVSKKVITKIHEEKLTKDEDILALLNTLLKQEILFTMYITGDPPYQKCKILSIDGVNFKWQTVQNSVSLKKQSTIHNVLSIEVCSDSDLFNKVQKNVSRLSIIDLDLD